jgi:hypothetical protein
MPDSHRGEASRSTHGGPTGGPGTAVPPAAAPPPAAEPPASAPPAATLRAAEPPAAEPQPLRRVEIVPLGAAAETANVLRIAALIVFATWVYIADTGGAGGGGSATPDLAAASAQTGGAGGAVPAAGASRDLMPYQRLFISLGGAEQRMFRELQEGLLEAENVRGAARGGGQWPAPAVLAAQGVPPFADAAAPGRPRYRWEMRHDGLYVGYLGEAAAAAAPAFLVVVQEPDPRAPADPAAPPAGAPNDEVHHRLADGTVLHVGIWMHTAAPAAPAGAAGAAGAAGDTGDMGDALLAAPYARGWTQLLAGTGR